MQVRCSSSSTALRLDATAFSGFEQQCAAWKTPQGAAGTAGGSAARELLADARAGGVCAGRCPTSGTPSRLPRRCNSGAVASADSTGARSAPCSRSMEPAAVGGAYRNRCSKPRIRVGPGAVSAGGGAEAAPGGDLDCGGSAPCGAAEAPHRGTPTSSTSGSCCRSETLPCVSAGARGAAVRSTPSRARRSAMQARGAPETASDAGGPLSPRHSPEQPTLRGTLRDPPSRSSPVTKLLRRRWCEASNELRVLRACSRRLRWTSSTFASR